MYIHGIESVSGVDDRIETEKLAQVNPSHYNIQTNKVTAAHAKAGPVVANRNSHWLTISAADTYETIVLIGPKQKSSVWDAATAASFPLSLTQSRPPPFCCCIRFKDPLVNVWLQHGRLGSLNPVPVCLLGVCVFHIRSKYQAELQSAHRPAISPDSAITPHDQTSPCSGELFLIHVRLIPICIRRPL